MEGSWLVSCWSVFFFFLILKGFGGRTSGFYFLSFGCLVVAASE